MTDDIWDEGYCAYYNDLDINPYQEGTDKNKEWWEGWKRAKALDNESFWNENYN